MQPIEAERATTTAEEAELGLALLPRVAVDGAKLRRRGGTTRRSPEPLLQNPARCGGSKVEEDAAAAATTDEDNEEFGRDAENLVSSCDLLRGARGGGRRRLLASDEVCDGFEFRVRHELGGSGRHVDGPGADLVVINELPNAYDDVLICRTAVMLVSVVEGSDGWCILPCFPESIGVGGGGPGGMLDDVPALRVPCPVGAGVAIPVNPSGPAPKALDTLL